MIKTRFIIFGLILLVFITYFNSLNNVFLSDDLAEIVQNPNIGNLGHAISTHSFSFMRPVLYSLTYNIFGLNPVFFRLINILFHIGSVLVIFAIFKYLKKTNLGILVASVFAVHPAIGEAVVWISGGMYPQYTFFFLLSFYLYIRGKDEKKYYWPSVFTFLLSFYGHPQMPTPLFVMFPLWELSFGNLKKNFIKTIPFFVIAVFYLFVSFGGLQERVSTLQSTHYQQLGKDNLLITLPISISSYFELIFWPKTLTLYHSELNFGHIEFIIRAALTVLFLAGILVAFKKHKFIFFWSSLFLVALAPTLTPFRLNWLVAERYLYLPILGIIAVTAFGFEKLVQKIKLKWLFVVWVAVTIALMGRSINRNIDWKNEDNLWIATGKTSPSSPNTHNNLGDVYGRWGDKQRALQEFQKAIELKPNYGDAYHNLANTYRELGQIDKALENYQNALKFNPNLWQSYQNIAAIYFEQKQYGKAQENIQQAIQINPKNINLYINLGVVYLIMGEKEKAKEVFNLVLSADPQNQMARQGLIEANK